MSLWFFIGFVYSIWFLLPFAENKAENKALMK